MSNTHFRWIILMVTKVLVLVYGGVNVVILRARSKNYLQPEHYGQVILGIFQGTLRHQKKGRHHPHHFSRVIIGGRMVSIVVSAPVALPTATIIPGHGRHQSGRERRIRGCMRSSLLCVGTFHLIYNLRLALARSRE